MHAILFVLATAIPAGCPCGHPMPRLQEAYSYRTYCPSCYPDDTDEYEFEVVVLPATTTDVPYCATCAPPCSCQQTGAPTPTGYSATQRPTEAISSSATIPVATLRSAGVSSRMLFDKLSRALGAIDLPVDPQADNFYDEDTGTVSLTTQTKPMQGEDYIHRVNATITTREVSLVVYSWRKGPRAPKSISDDVVARLKAALLRQE